MTLGIYRGCGRRHSELWSEMDIVDLAISTALGTGAAETASFLCRGFAETIAKARELGLKLRADDEHRS